MRTLEELHTRTSRRVGCGWCILQAVRDGGSATLSFERVSRGGLQHCRLPVRHQLRRVPADRIHQLHAGNQLRQRRSERHQYDRQPGRRHYGRQRHSAMHRLK